MSARSFFDSNVLVYTDDQDNPDKMAAALDLLAEHRRRRSSVVSTQVLQEYFVAATRKLGVDAGLARRKVALFGRSHLATPGLDDMLAAVDLHRLHRLSFWDAMIVRSALASNCSLLFTEDMQHGWRIDGLEVVDPFR